jgi:hypothetical protein
MCCQQPVQGRPISVMAWGSTKEAHVLHGEWMMGLEERG